MADHDARGPLTPVPAGDPAPDYFVVVHGPGGATWYQCQWCAALVLDTARHHAFHQALARLDHRAR